MYTTSIIMSAVHIHLDHWIASISSDPTVVVTVTTHLDVTIHTPTCTPAT